jgi:MerR family transcriptional regulator, light-induced transcriptional regulator
MPPATEHPKDLPRTGHPIAIVAERTGLSRDVLRAWERRYAAVAPTRSDGGQRLYSDEDIERFRLLAAATRHGRTISLVAALSNDQLAQLVAEDEAALPVPTQPGASSHELVEDALACIRSLDAEALEHVLKRAHARLGTAAFLEDVVPRLMQDVGALWAAGSMTIAQEHLASAAVIGIVLDAARTLRPESHAPRLLVATPAGEVHSVGAALVAGMGALDGWAITYLGPDVPSGELADAARSVSAHAVALSVVAPRDPDQVVRELLALRVALPPSVALIVGGAATASMVDAIERPGLHRCTSLAELRHLLTRVHRR